MIYSDSPNCGRWGTLLLLTVALVSGGCAGPRSTLELLSYKDPYFPEKHTLEFSGATYWIDPSHEIRLAGCAAQTDLDGNPLTEYVDVQVYWYPRPGKTHADPTMLNAMIRYTVAGESGVAVYSGTGFAYPEEGWGKQLKVAIESASLQLVELKGEVPNPLGRTRLTGTLVADLRPNETAETLRVAELRAVR